MLLLLTNQTTPATTLGYLAHKHPARAQAFDLPFGKAHVFYPEADEARCTLALLLDVDPVGMVRGAGAEPGLFQYVNDRPYTASSFLSVAISRVLGSALGGRCKDMPELVDAPLDLRAEVPVVRARGGEHIPARLFTPLGYEVDFARHAYPNDEGPSPYGALTLSARRPLHELLTHLYVLLPVLDGDKHYWVGDGEVDKLLARGEGWLERHPERELITARYLKHRRPLVRAALARLVSDDTPDPEADEAGRDAAEASIERPLKLNDVRLDTVVEVLEATGARRVLDLGCGEGRLLARLLERRGFDEVVGVDASIRSLNIAADRLKLDEMAPRQKERIRLVQGALTYRDRSLEGYDAAALVEVVEHLDSARLESLERVVFGCMAPATVVVTTPNVEYNVRFENLPAGRFRHPDHRFEWTRDEFRAWCAQVCERHGYHYEWRPVGAVDEEVGPPTQMGVFSR